MSSLPPVKNIAQPVHGMGVDTELVSADVSSGHGGIRCRPLALSLASGDLER